MNRLFTLVLAVLLALSLNLGCDKSDSIEEVIVQVKVAGYYVSQDASEVDQAKLRLGVFCRTISSDLMELSSAGVARNPTDATVREALITLSEKPPSACARTVDYSNKLEIWPYLDEDADQTHTQVDTALDAVGSRAGAFVYYFSNSDASSGIVKGYNYQAGAKYRQDFEMIPATDTDAKYYVETKQYTPSAL